jgi:hypothetical protein
VLVPVFLFARIAVQDCECTAIVKNDGSWSFSAVRPCLFQRPPPSSIA